MQKGPSESSLLGLFLLLFFLDALIRAAVAESVTTVCNYGIGLGIMLPAGLLWLILGILWLFVVFQRERAPLSSERSLWTLLLLGGLSNGLDRLFNGCITDYLHLPFFPSFNIADIMLFLGVIWLSARLLGTFRRN